MSHNFETTIGLEIHVQLATKAKLFSASPTEFGKEPNSNVSYLDAAMPGMLPVLNQQAVEKAVAIGLALGAKINLTSQFDRKHYFYPDLPQGYQISQFHKPIAEGGGLEIESQAETKTIKLTRIHMEQDAGKSLHEANLTAVDLNRSGTPLVEIVTEPMFHSPEEVGDFIRKLRSILITIGASNANMEEGNLRADVNVSLAKKGDKLGTRAEIKNLNSVRFIQQAIAFEVKRQTALLTKGEKVEQQTRLFNTQSGETFSMRSKEESHDYRYFPDPDLPPLVLTEQQVAQIKQSLPSLPAERQARWLSNYGISEAQAKLLSTEPVLGDFFEEVAPPKTTDGETAKLVAKWIVGELMALMNKHKLATPPMPATEFAVFMGFIRQGKISERAAKELLPKLKHNAEKLITESGLLQLTDDSAMGDAIDQVLKAHQDKVAQYQQGKQQLFGFFVGQVMQATKGRANPKRVTELLQAKLKRS